MLLIPQCETVFLGNCLWVAQHCCHQPKGKTQKCPGSKSALPSSQNTGLSNFICGILIRGAWKNSSEKGKHRFLDHVLLWIAHRQKLMITHPKLLCFMWPLSAASIPFLKTKALYGFMKCESGNALERSL